MFSVSCFVNKPTFILHAFHTRWILPILQTVHSAMHHSIDLSMQMEFCFLSKDFKSWCTILINIHDTRQWFGHWPENILVFQLYLEWIKMKYRSDVGKSFTTKQITCETMKFENKKKVMMKVNQFGNSRGKIFCYGLDKQIPFCDCLPIWPRWGFCFTSTQPVILTNLRKTARLVQSTELDIGITLMMMDFDILWTSAIQGLVNQPPWLHACLLTHDWLMLPVQM